jgi:hypothetical protein
MELIQINKGNLVINGYDTDKDEKRAVKDINRLLIILAGMSMSEINKYLEPFRRKVAKGYDDEAKAEEYERN